MIEVGIFDIGTLTSMEFKELPGPQYVPDAELSEIHRHAQQMTLRQIERIVLADRLGFDYYWNSEHHFNIEGTEISPNPLQVQTAAAALTRRIRLGQIANIVSWHHPLRLAEQVAILDIISGGRTEVGLGRGYQPRETETFGATYGSSHQDQERNRSYYHEACEILVKAWTQDSFSHHGEFFSLPPSWTTWNHRTTINYHSQPGRDPHRYFNFGAAAAERPLGLLDAPVTMRELSVLPQPVQKPHPPLWESVISPRSVTYAAQHGFNAYFMSATVEELRAATEQYHAEAAKAGWPDALGRGEFRYGWDAERHRGVCCGRFVHVVEGGVGDKRAALRRAAIQFDWLKPFGGHAVFAQLAGHPPGFDVALTPELLDEADLLIVGGKQEVLERLMELKETVFGPGDAMLSLWLEAACASDGAVLEQMHVVAEEILPELRRACGGASIAPAPEAA